MIRPETEEAIEKFLRSVEKHLPDGFETEDLIVDLKEHIIEALSNKMEARPQEDQLIILDEVLEELGAPEEIADEFMHAHLTEEEKVEALIKTKLLYRLVISIAISIAAALVLVRLIESLEFYTTLSVLILFAVLETGIRSWQFTQQRK